MIDDVTVPTAGRGACGVCRIYIGVWLRFFGEVSWEGPQGEFIYWQGRVATWERSDYD